MSQFFILSGAVLGFLSVAFGAFGAHALQGAASLRDLDAFKTAAHYQLAHALILVCVGLAFRSTPSALLKFSGYAFLFGTLVFSGTLYLLVLTQTRVWGAVTPIGGISLLVGWALLALAAWKKF
jgi:uncharacterized membrane protein YgdD (TMEM256/DUF423 family)